MIKVINKIKKSKRKKILNNNIFQPILIQTKLIKILKIQKMLKILKIKKIK